MLKRLAIFGFALLTSLGWAGSFTYKDKNVYIYRGTVETADLLSFADLISWNDKLTIEIDSYGGDYQAGLILGALTKEHNVHIVVDSAWSSAGFWALSDKKHTFKSKESILGIHLPFMNGFEFLPETWMISGVVLCDYLETCGFTHKEAKGLIETMTSLRKTYGREAVVAWKQDGMYIIHPKD